MSTDRGPLGPTHEVENQPPPLVGYNTFESDRALVEALHREGGGWAEDSARALGELAGSAEAQAWGEQANTFTPVLRTHDRFGHRIDTVDFHPSWHELMRVAVANGLHALPWRAAPVDRGARRPDGSAASSPGAVSAPRTPCPGAHAARAALFATWTVDAGHGCPMSMTASAIPVLRAEPEIASEWEPRLTSLEYDPADRPAAEKSGALCGMAMTEKQGGSDLRSNSTRAEPAGGGEYLLTGHKWFCSGVMCDVFLTLARTERGLTCFLLPRWNPDGTRNGFHIMRLKDKLGNRSNATGEVEFAGARARMVGEEGHGVRTIMEMVNHTRLDCTTGSAAGMRVGVAQAIHHAANRAAFGRDLIDQPLMRNVLADLAVESEAATITAMRLARAFDSAAADEREAALKRLATPVAKYWVCKRWPMHAAEALECLGGSGYVEESGMPRLFRESPVNVVWEGSGNVICLDVLRAMAKSPESVEAFFAELDESAGADERLDAFVAGLRAEMSDLEAIEARARRLVERMALALQGSLVLRYAHPAVAEAFLASRLAGGGLAFGTLPPGVDFGAIIERSRPKL